MKGKNQFFWSPDGNKFCFVTEKDGNSDIYVVDMKFNKQLTITYNSADYEDPVWSPYSKNISFISDKKKTKELSVVDYDDINLFRLTFDLTNDILS